MRCRRDPHIESTTTRFIWLYVVFGTSIKIKIHRFDERLPQFTESLSFIRYKIIDEQNLAMKNIVLKTCVD